MGGLFGGGGGTTTTEPRAAGIRVQTSTRGLTLAVVLGRNRVSGNLIWAGDFTATAHSIESGGGKGGGPSYTNITYTYTTSFMLGLCEGPITAINAAWRDKEYLPNATQGTYRTETSVANETYNIPWDGGVYVIGQPADMTEFQGVYTGQPETGYGSYLTEGVDYTRSGGTITFTAWGGFPGDVKTVTVAYAWSRQVYVPPLLTPFLGTYPQTVWSNLTSRHPSQALGYPGIAYVAAADKDLGSDPSIGNYSFDVTGRLSFGGGIDDANPKDIVVDIAINPNYGAGFNLDNFGDLTAYSNWCVASGIFLSPVYSAQAPAHEVISRLVELTNSGIYPSEGKLKIVPLGDTAVSGNGVVYTPPAAPLYDLTDDDFLVSGDEDPVRVTRIANADAVNQVLLAYRNRANEYNDEIAEAKDQVSIDLFGLRPMDTMEAHEIATAAVANKVAHLILQRKQCVRNTYEFTLGWKYCLLEPTDIVTLTETALGLDHTPVRITGIEEDEGGHLSITAEDYPAGVNDAAVYPSDTGSAYALDYNVPPGDIVLPAFVEAPVFQTATGLKVGAAVTGVSENWGGCDVWVSYDGDTYKRLMRVVGGARYGYLTDAITAAAGQVADVQLLGRGGQLLSGSAVEAANLATLCLVGDECVGHSTSTLLAANRYDLTLAKRGGHNTVAVSHAAGERFVRLDDAIAWSEDLDLSMIGKTIYFKFCSFNVFGSAIQGLADVQAYGYQVTGTMAKLPPSDVTGLQAIPDVGGMRLVWNDIADPDRYDYEVRVGESWEAGTLIARTAALEHRLPPLSSSAPLTFWVAARDVFFNVSAVPTSLEVTATAPVAPAASIALAGKNYRLTWSEPAAMFQIDHYEIRYGATWGAGTSLGTTKGTALELPVGWSGSRQFFVAAVDVAGNVGAASAGATLVITTPSAPTVTAQVIDNNVLLYWSDASATLPVEFYEIRRGATWAGATVVGTKAGLFTSLFETSSGTYTYWLAGIDSAGNVGTPASVTSTVAQPPDYVLLADIDSTFAGTLSNAFLESGVVLLPVNTSESVADHFDDNSWADPQAQIDDGFPLYIQPAASSGYYEEVIDYGTALASSKVTITAQLETVAGTPTTSVRISISLDGSSYTDYDGVTEVYATNFRYVKVRVTVSSSGDDLARLTALNVRLDVKIRSITGMVSANAADSGGTTVYITDDGTSGGVPIFADVDSIQVTPQGTAALIVVYDFTDAPNPTEFKVLLFNTSGTRQSGTVSYDIRGY